MHIGFSCNKEEPSKLEQVRVDLEEIKERGRLIALTDYNVSNYFIYKGKPMGFQFELLREFADYSGIEIEIIANSSINDKMDLLSNREADVIATNMTITGSRQERFAFTVPLAHTRQVLVQRTKENSARENNNLVHYVEGIENLYNSKSIIYVHKSSSYADQLKEINKQTGRSIQFMEVDESTERLIELVSEGRIQYTICDEKIARLVSHTYENLDFSVALSSAQPLAWAVRKESTDLLQLMNTWLSQFQRTTRYKILYAKYFRNSNFKSLMDSEYFTLKTGKISKFDDAIKNASSILGWDWKLIASLIYQESRFNPHAISRAGAFGLMQFMPNTARSFGVNPSSSPEQQILAGVKYLKWLDDRFKQEIEDSTERSKFVLASYNAGLGHIRDAQRLAGKFGRNPYLWEDNVEFYVLQKAKPEFYNDEVVFYGYVRGSETFKYVHEILDRYNHYAELINNPFL